ncbi:hypothetical protein GMOD_00007955 [Pyrenophora seminiperda CCB06]|uniref:Uncharacterized protein n=1 Tax=Pyrenophora seminiperda CCB06 TaxID=1302712 RepID=A0A3M7MFY7_9PLEO|nr:hypothetical protein GMOD_00007955 [Pyrenophora seminiperda CCB06]
MICSRICTIFVYLWLVHVARATTFNPNCTLPPEGTNYVAGSNVRSTLEIFWSALYTIFVCTWAVQHLNVPPQEEYPEELPEFNDATKKPTRLWESTCKSLAGLPASTSKFLKDIPASTGKLWRQTWRRLKWMLITIVLPEFLLGRAMGDFIAAHRFAKNFKGGWTATHGFYANSGGFVLRLRPSSRVVAVDTAQLDYLVKKKRLINTRPPITKAEILEKSQGDVFATLSAMVQLLWLVIQLIVRKVNHLHSSQLEIAALSFAVIPNDRYNSDAELFMKQTKKIRKNEKGEKELYDYKWGITGEDCGFLIGAVILGACHCIAWNFAFPTPIERTLWRAAAGIITGIMPLFYMLWFTFVLLIPRSKVDSEPAEVVLAWLAYMVYGVCRLYLLGAAFRELFFLPPGAFVATWSVSFPHFG